MSRKYFSNSDKADNFAAKVGGQINRQDNGKTTVDYSSNSDSTNVTQEYNGDSDPHTYGYSDEYWN